MNQGVIWTPDELKRAILEEWDRITLDEVNRQIDSMPERVQAVAEACGGPTRFSNRSDRIKNRELSLFLAPGFGPKAKSVEG